MNFDDFPFFAIEKRAHPGTYLRLVPEILISVLGKNTDTVGQCGLNDP